MSGARRIIDISRPLGDRTAPWPGDTPFTLTWEWRIASGRPVNLSRLSLSPHVGTHVDAPLHVRDGAPGIDGLDLDAFVGRARVIDVSLLPGRPIGADALAGIDLAEPPRILLKTGTNRDIEKWNPCFAGLDPDAARLLVRAGARLVGLDTPGVDPPDSEDLAVHHILEAAGLRWIENLDLSAAEPGIYDLVALPLRILGGDASPVRAILIQTEP